MKKPGRDVTPSQTHRRRELERQTNEDPMVWQVRGCSECRGQQGLLVWHGREQWSKDLEEVYLAKERVSTRGNRHSDLARDGYWHYMTARSAHGLYTLDFMPFLPWRLFAVTGSHKEASSKQSNGTKVSPTSACFLSHTIQTSFTQQINSHQCSFQNGEGRHKRRALDHQDTGSFHGPTQRTDAAHQRQVCSD